MNAETAWRSSASTCGSILIAIIYRATHDNILRIKSEQTIRFGKALSSITHETVSIQLSFR